MIELTTALPRLMWAYAAWWFLSGAGAGAAVLYAAWWAIRTYRRVSPTRTTNGTPGDEHRACRQSAPCPGCNRADCRNPDCVMASRRRHWTPWQVFVVLAMVLVTVVCGAQTLSEAHVPDRSPAPPLLECEPVSVSCIHTPPPTYRDESP